MNSLTHHQVILLTWKVIKAALLYIAPAVILWLWYRVEDMRALGSQDLARLTGCLETLATVAGATRKEASASTEELPSRRHQAGLACLRRSGLVVPWQHEYAWACLPALKL